MVSLIILIVITIIIGILIYKADKDSGLAIMGSSCSFVVLGEILLFITCCFIPGNVVDTKDYSVYEATNKEAYYINDNNEMVKVDNLSSCKVSYGNVLKPTVRKREYDNTYIIKFSTFELILPNRDIVED